jgi:hypothetical protein
MRRTKSNKWISFMKELYSTLVALDGKNADSGLPGVRENSRKEIGYSVRIEGSYFVAGPHIHINDVMDRGS